MPAIVAAVAGGIGVGIGFSQIAPVSMVVPAYARRLTLAVLLVLTAFDIPQIAVAMAEGGSPSRLLGRYALRVLFAVCVGLGAHLTRAAIRDLRHRRVLASVRRREPIP